MLGRSRTHSAPPALPQAVRPYEILTLDYALTGHREFGRFHMDGNGVNQQLAFPLSECLNSILCDGSADSKNVFTLGFADMCSPRANTLPISTMYPSKNRRTLVCEQTDCEQFPGL
jgi:hypothetical protein